jgi:hypothetical protein
MSDDDGGGDCSTDGTCGDDEGGIAITAIPGIKVATTTLLEESRFALEQFSIGTRDQIKTKDVDSCPAK